MQLLQTLPNIWKDFIVWHTSLTIVFTARRYASTIYAVIVCLSVRHESVFYQDG